MKESFFASIAVATLASSPSNAQERAWIGHSYDDGAALIYGVPDSGDMTLSFDCATNSETLAFIYAFEPANASDGVQVEVVLQAGDVVVPVATTGTRLEMDDAFVLEGELKLDAKTRQLITGQGALQVFAADGSEEIPLEGASEAAKSLLEACAPS